MRRPALLPSFSLALAAALLGACGGGDGAKAPQADAAAALAALPAPYNAADLANGKQRFNQCRACHTLVEGGPDLVGPNLYGVFGRAVGSREGYRYSEAVQAADFVWDGPHLERWLADPRGFLPGTKMTFPGIESATDRRDVIAYVMVETGHAAAPR